MYRLIENTSDVWETLLMKKKNILYNDENITLHKNYTIKLLIIIRNRLLKKFANIRLYYKRSLAVS